MARTPLALDLRIGDDGRVSAGQFRPLPRYGLYVVVHDPQILRVGESSSGENRLKKGFREPLRRKTRGKERKNYNAYAWRDEFRGKQIRVDYFELSEGSFRDSHFRRALEAEVTFQMRIARKKWPSRMNEIHFEETLRADPLIFLTAETILRHYQVSYDGTI